MNISLLFMNMHVKSQKTEKKNPQSSNKNPQQIQITTLVHRGLLNKTEWRIQI